MLVQILHERNEKLYALNHFTKLRVRRAEAHSQSSYFGMLLGWKCIGKEGCDPSPQCNFQSDSY